MKNFLFSALFIVLTISTLSAQRDRTLFGSGGLDLTGAWGGSQIALTSFGDEYGTLQGGFGGIEFNKNFFIGWGSYSTFEFDGIDQVNNDTYEMRYNGLMLGYGLKSYKVFHPQVNVLLGGGRKEETGMGVDGVFVAQPGLGVEVNVFRWFRVGLNGGYRIVMNDDLATVDNTFSGGYGNITFKFGWSWGR
jgi:hypothetical protein